MTGDELGVVCTHGQLERVCPLCELTAELTAKDKRIAELETERNEWRDQCAFVAAAKDANINALSARIAALEDRLELFAEDGDGKPVRFDIGDGDGIDCRNTTIALQDLRIDKQAERLARSESARDALAGLVRDMVPHLERFDRGSTHWHGCESEHPRCALRARARAALEGKHG